MSEYAVMPLRDYVDTCNYIRGITGKTDRIKSGKLIEEIEEVSNKRTFEGYEQGLEEGKQSAYDEFWDTFQQNGNRTNYSSSFGSGWTPEIFKPKYPLRPDKATQMFFNNMWENILIEDFVEFSKENNIILDFSNCTIATQGLATLKTKHFGVLNFSKCTGLYDLFYTHGNSNGVVTIDEFICSETTTFSANTFQNATYLTNIKMSGVIACDINFSKNTRLTAESLRTIIACLKNIKNTGVTRTLTLNSTCVARLTEEEKAVVTEEKGWSLVW
jgi:hypothetical protein